MSTGTITRLPLPTACTESCVYGCQGWIIWPSSLRERLSSTMRSDAVWMPLVSDLATPFSSTSSTRTDSAASAAVVDSHTSASIGQLMYMSSASGAVWYRSEEHTSELQSLMRTSYAVFCLKTKINTTLIEIGI